MAVSRRLGSNEDEEISEFCDLQCDATELTEPKDVHEYVGPVKLILIDPDPRTYRRKLWETACLSLSQLLIGATTMIVMLFVLSIRMPLSVNAHILLCTTGYQLFVPLSILVADHRETSSLPLTRRDEKKEHLIMSSVGSFFGIGGTLLAQFVKYDPKFPNGWPLICNATISATKHSLKPRSVTYLRWQKMEFAHALFAWITLGLALAAMITGPLALVLKLESGLGKLYKAFHALFGLALFMSASACFIFGLFDVHFESWLECARAPEGLYILVFLTVAYTVIITTVAIIKMLYFYN